MRSARTRASACARREPALAVRLSGARRSRPHSDVDVLISAPPAHDFSLLDLAGVRVELCDLLGRDTGVVILEDVQPRFWETIRDDLVEVF